MSDDYQPSGPGRRRTKPVLTTHVPIRFTPEIIVEVKRLADKDRKTVSTWIRNVVEDEIERRGPKPSSYSVGQPGLNIVTEL